MNTVATKNFQSELDLIMMDNFDYLKDSYTFSQACSICKFILETEHSHEIAPKDYGWIKEYVKDYIRTQSIFSKIKKDFSYLNWRILHGSEIKVL